jgi:2-polyprenyl-3-methyl-5-hydroxy-6-metoxy-1,4-benzoquinol methylase
MSELNNYYNNNREEMLQFIPESYATVLEIGCGQGNFKHNLNNSCEYWGVEQNEIIGKKAEDKLYKVIIGDFMKINKLLPDHYFDLIICNDIIEHIDEYNLFFKILKKKMNTNANIIGSIPNVRFYSNLIRLIILKDWEYVNDGILDRTHLRFFTKKSLIRIFKNNNFSIEKFRGINGIKFSMFPVKLILKNICIFLLGLDSRYFQYGFCIKKNK